MGALADKAVSNHKSFYSCSASVLCAFAEEINLTEQQARSAASPFAGGRMGKCGAVMAAEYVLAISFGEDSGKIADFEKRFIDKNKSVMCSELRGTKRSCRGCVTDSAELLESMLEE